jgi:hypothetical protein
MGPGIIVPLVLVAIVVPVAFTWARRTFRQHGTAAGSEPDHDPKVRLTSNALRALPAPAWRVVYEIAHDKLGGVEHVLIGPSGIFALRTSMEPLPVAVAEPDPHDVGRAAIVRGTLDDALRRCAMTSTSLVTIHWGVNPGGAPAALQVIPGSTAVDGRRFDEWVEAQAGGSLTPAQVDLAWQTVLTSIGRPDPLA